MMASRSRPYASAADLRKMQAAVARAYAITSLRVGDLAWLTRYQTHRHLALDIRLWEGATGEVIGWTYLRAFGGFNVFVAPGRADDARLDEMLATVDAMARAAVALGDPPIGLYTYGVDVGRSEEDRALAAALASAEALAGPLERGGIGIPAAGGRFEPGDEVVWRGRCVAGQRPADEDGLDRLGHVQPGAAQRGVQRHDAVLHQPQDQARGLVAGQVVEDQQQAQGRQAVGQGEGDGEPGLPAFPGRTTLGLGLDRRLRQRREDRRQFGLQPGVQHRVGGARHPLDADRPGRWVEQGQQLGGAVAEGLVGRAGRAGRRPPVCSRLGDRLVRPGLILGPDRQLGLGIRVLDQPPFAVASGAWTSTSPTLRRRFASPVWHHDRSRCPLRSASGRTHQMVSVLPAGSPSSAVRSARWSVVNDQVAVWSRSRSGVRRTSARMRSRSAAPDFTLGPPPWRGSTAASPSRLNRATSSPTASPARPPTRPAASVYEQPSATARSARARVTIPTGALVARPNCSSLDRASSVSARSGSFRRRLIPRLPNDGIASLDRYGYHHAK